jgi:hypothetical protein
MGNLDWVLHNHEGQFFERKSCYDRSKGKAKLRPAHYCLTDEELDFIINYDIKYRMGQEIEHSGDD